MFTYVRKKPFSGTRLAFIIIEQGIVSWIKQCEIGPGLKSDHSYITASIEPISNEWGPS